MTLTPANQLTLFTTKRAPERVQLDADAWIEHLRGWYPESDVLFATLSAEASWERRRRWMFTRYVEEPRLTAEFPSLAEAPVAAVREMGARLSSSYGVDYDSAWLNLYRDHNDSTAWHGNRPSCKRSECIVPVLSLGATRRFLVRRKEGGTSIPFVVESGDLVVMGGRCQSDWVHCVPKQKAPAGPRISVNFGSSFQATKE